MLHSKIEGTGKPLLILHGFLGMADNWKTLGLQYAALGFETHLLDLRNHGKSFHSDRFDYEVMVEDVLEYCKGKTLEKISVIGHSMGGKIAMLFATQHPEMVEKLIVADIGPKFYPQHHDLIFEALNAVDFSKKPSRNAVEVIMKQHISDFGTLQFLLKNLYWKAPEQLAFRFNLSVFNANKDQIGKPLPDDARFNKQTLFIRGGNSNYILDEDWASIQKHFPEAKLETIADVGHWLHAENPKLFLEITGLFLVN